MDWDELLKTSAEVGIGFSDFWAMTPRDFHLWVKGVQRRGYVAHVQFREAYALHVNVNRDPKKPAVHGRDIWPHPLDEAAPPPRRTQRTAQRISAKRQAFLDELANRI